MSARRKVLLIGLDAFDAVLVEEWIRDGSLPNLAQLRRAGTWGRLSTSAGYLAGSPWPTFYTGQPPSVHGIYHDFQWRHEHMGYEAPNADWLPLDPFWRYLVDGVRVVAYDVPMVQGCRPFPGVEVSGWASHDKLAPPASWPPDTIEDIRRRFGSWPNHPEEFGPASLKALLGLRDHLLENTRHSTAVASWLLEKPWDLGIVVLSAAHPGGHRLWDRSSVEGKTTGDAGTRFDGALKEIYVGCDRAVGEILGKSGDATAVVFSLHGTMANASRVEYLDAMLGRILLPHNATKAGRSGLRSFGEALPLSWRRFLTRNIPAVLRNRLMTLWATGGTNWTTTRAFSLRADLQGYVRLNLRGRESQGIVEPGVEQDRLLEVIADGLNSFRDAVTGAPVVEKVLDVREVYPEGGRRERLPDLLVCWPDSPGRFQGAIESVRFGRIEPATPGRIPDGRSGNHRPQGFLIARGEGIPADGEIRNGADILDLAPTVVRMLDAVCSVPLAGRAIPELTGAR